MKYKGVIMAKGIVYIVKNPAFPHLIKIGYTCQNSVKDRGLDSSNVPEDYEIISAYTCDNPQEVERHMHALFKQYRHHTMTGRQTEFFYVSCAGLAKEQLDLLAGATHNVTNEFKASTENVQESNAVYNLSKALESYDEEYHLNGKSEKMVDLYKQFKKALLKACPDLTMRYRKFYLSFKLKKRTISDVEIQNKQLKIYINAKKGTLTDKLNLTRDISSTGSWGNGDYQIIIKDNKNIADIIDMIKQSI